MSIKYKRNELIDFFKREPVTISEEADGDWLYIYERNEFKLILSLSTYCENIDIAICYNEKTVYDKSFEHIGEIYRLNIYEVKIVGELQNITLNKFPQISAIIENKETSHNSDIKTSRISILFDEFDFFEFFESDPTVIGTEKDGRLQYFYQTEDFKMIFDLSIYEHKVNISISHTNDIVYSEQFNSVEEIRKVDADTLRMITEDKWIIVRKWSQISVQVEDRPE